MVQLFAILTLKNEAILTLVMCPESVGCIADTL